MWLVRVQVGQTGSVFVSSLLASDFSVMLEIFPVAPRPCVHFGMAALPHAYKWASSEWFLESELLVWKRNAVKRAQNFTVFHSEAFGEVIYRYLILNCN